MDRNSAIGFTLIAVLLLLYFNLAVDPPTPPTTSPVVTGQDSLQLATADTLRTPVPLDSVITRALGDWASLAQGTADEITVENADLLLTFSTQGYLRQVELRKFKTYSQEPLRLISPASNRFDFPATLGGREINLFSLYYQPEVAKVGDSSRLTFTAASTGGRIRHIYTIPPSGYEVRYRLETEQASVSQLTWLWRDALPLVEKDLRDSRAKTTINYTTAGGSFNGLSEASTDPEEKVFTEPMQWVAVRQKFFVSAVISDASFAGGRVAMTTPAASDQIVKETFVQLQLPVAPSVGWTFYFGPNDYDILGTVAPEFSRNLYLGWPPVIWVNKFIIIPIFSFLEQYIGNYGVIIILLVLFIKLLLTPLSYRSYMGMAKMRLLKPELDAIKEKNGDNMAQAQQDQMKLYQQAGVNPFSGCIPLVLQMPILFAMFYFFPVSIELRQESFLWAEDLSTYDSILSLPFTIPFYGSHVSLFTILMTVSTLIYTWQNNQISSVQGPMKSLSYIMPVVFMFVLNSFSAGLSFYYFVSNLVTFAQQAIIKRFVDEDKILAIMEENKKKAATGTGKKSKFMAKLEEAMKASEEARKTAEQAKKGKKK